jgi:putative hydrolase of the HAD superfamily
VSAAGGDPGAEAPADLPEAGTPSGVIFDFGGVIWNMRWDVCRTLETTHGLSRGSVFATLYGSDTWREVERGRGDRAAWLTGAHAALEAQVGRALPAVHDAWRDAQGPIAENVALIRRLRPPYRLSILSNADWTLRTRLREELDILDCFDDVISSAEVGLAKPDAAIYRLACARLALAPAACVFVDDHEPNVRAAEAAGLRGILHRHDRGDDLVAQLAAVGVAPRRA